MFRPRLRQVPASSWHARKQFPRYFVKRTNQPVNLLADRIRRHLFFTHLLEQVNKKGDITSIVPDQLVIVDDLMTVEPSDEPLSVGVTAPVRTFARKCCYCLSLYISSHTWDYISVRRSCQASILGLSILGWWRMHE